MEYVDTLTRFCLYWRPNAMELKEVSSAQKQGSSPYISDVSVNRRP